MDIAFFIKNKNKNIMPTLLEPKDTYDNWFLSNTYVHMIIFCSIKVYKMINFVILNTKII